MKVLLLLLSLTIFGCETADLPETPSAATSQTPPEEPPPMRSNPLLLSSRPRLLPPGALLWQGDSLTEGLLLAPGEGFTYQANDFLTALGYQYSTVNAGVGGTTTNQMNTAAPTTVDPFIVLGGQLRARSFVSTIATLESGINDFIAGGTVASVKAQQEEWLARERALGSVTALVLICRCNPATVGGTFEANRLALNEIWRTTNRSLVDIIIDGVNDPAFLSAEAPLSPGYLPDGVHYNAYGAQVRGLASATAIQEYLNTH